MHSIVCGPVIVATALLSTQIGIQILLWSLEVALLTNALHKDLGLSIRVPEPCFICREKSVKAETSKSDVPVLQGLWKGLGFFWLGWELHIVCCMFLACRGFLGV